MPNLLQLCVKYFETKDFYEILEISNKATAKEVKKAYHKLSLKVHPDRVHDDEKLEATEKFKVLGSIHSILSNANKRAVYDETGTCDEDEVAERNWMDYWRVLFKKITEEDIRNYEKEYIGSKEELKDLKQAYLNGKGDMDYIVDHVQFARSEQEPRLRELLNNMIEKDEIPAYKIFTNEPEKKRKRRHAKENREAKEAEKFGKQMEKETGTTDLALMIKRAEEERASKFDNFFDNLEAKYGGGSSQTKPAKRRQAPKTASKAKKRKSN